VGIPQPAVLLGNLGKWLMAPHPNNMLRSVTQAHELGQFL